MAFVGIARPFAVSRLAVCWGLAFGVSWVHAQSSLQPADAVPPVGRLKDVVISASRVPEDVDQVSATVTVVSAEDVDRRGASSLEEALEGEVGISVLALPMRVQTAFSGTGRGGTACPVAHRAAPVDFVTHLR